MPLLTRKSEAAEDRIRELLETIERLELEHERKDALLIERTEERDEARAERDELADTCTVEYADAKASVRHPAGLALLYARAATSNGVHARVWSDGVCVWDSLRDGGSAPGRTPILRVKFPDAE